MDFVRSHFGKMKLWPVEHFFEHICHHFWVDLLLHPPESDDKYTWSEFHLSKVTFLQNQYFNLKVKTLQSKYYKARKLVIFSSPLEASGKNGCHICHFWQQACVMIVSGSRTLFICIWKIEKQAPKARATIHMCSSDKENMFKGPFFKVVPSKKGCSSLSSFWILEEISLC